MNARRHTPIRLFVMMFLLLTSLGTPGLSAQSGPPVVPAATAPPAAPSGPAMVPAEAIHPVAAPTTLPQGNTDVRGKRKGVGHGATGDTPGKHAYSPFESQDEPAACPPGGCDMRPGELLIRLAPAAAMPSADATRGRLRSDNPTDAALAAVGVKGLRRALPHAHKPSAGALLRTPEGTTIPAPDLTRWYRATVDKNIDIVKLVEKLGSTVGVELAEPDYVRRPVGERVSLPVAGTAATPAALPNASSDPLFAQQWHLGAVRAPQAWSYLESQGLPAGGNHAIVIAVIDTGVDYDHPDLAANMWTNGREVPDNGVDDDGNGYVDDIHGADMITGSGNPMDDHGHGTHVAGIIAMQAGNGIGGVGVAYNTQIMALKAAQYSGVQASSDIAEAINYAVAHGADVINMSFGGYARSQIEEDALATAFGQAVLVAAAGNDGKVNLPCPTGRDMYPAAYNWVLGVMASMPGGARAPFSNYDCKPHDSHEYELVAPGVDVWSTLPGGQYAAWDGTSMAAPVVSGIAALARTKFANKDIYSSRFIMGQIAANAAPLGDAYAALTVAPKPELTYLEHWLFDKTTLAAANDQDGIVDAGETIDLAVVIRNHWGKADNVSVKLEPLAAGAISPDPYVTMVAGTVNYGAVGPFSLDDNGLIYDDQGEITGVNNPFRFRVSATTPNDHIIAFRVTITTRNGMNTADTTTYTFQSRFSLLVQRGRELPRVISKDMTLTKDNYWIVSDATLIEAGVAVTVTEGTQIQFWSSDPASTYSGQGKPLLQVEGELLISGSAEQPVEMFNGVEWLSYPVVVRQMNNGHVGIEYAIIRNPLLGKDPDSVAPLDRIEHSVIEQEVASFISWRYPWGISTVAPEVRATQISRTVFRGLGARGLPSSIRPLWLMSAYDQVLFDETIVFEDTELPPIKRSVFLRNSRVPSEYDFAPYWNSLVHSQTRW